MIKAGLTGAVVGLIYVMSLTLFSPICTLCITPLLGVGVGYLAGWFDAPSKAETSLSRGGIAGAIAGFAVIIGQMLATVVNVILVTNSPQLPQLIEELGLPSVIIADSQQYWQTTFSVNAVCGLLNLVIIAGAGAVGGLIWFNRHQKVAQTDLSA